MRPITAITTNIIALSFHIQISTQNNAGAKTTYVLEVPVNWSVNNGWNKPPNAQLPRKNASLEHNAYFFINPAALAIIRTALPLLVTPPLFFGSGKASTCPFLLAGSLSIPSRDIVKTFPCTPLPSWLLTPLTYPLPVAIPYVALMVKVKRQ